MPTSVPASPASSATRSISSLPAPGIAADASTITLSLASVPVTRAPLRSASIASVPGAGETFTSKLAPRTTWPPSTITRARSHRSPLASGPSASVSVLALGAAISCAMGSQPRDPRRSAVTITDRCWAARVRSIVMGTASPCATRGGARSVRGASGSTGTQSEVRSVPTTTSTDAAVVPPHSSTAASATRATSKATRPSAFVRP